MAQKKTVHLMELNELFLRDLRDLTKGDVFFKIETKYFVRSAHWEH